ncbi:conserved oligomeric Golgi complex subunit 8-like [Dorcoceras hygrometricum]|uniref:Conserved oligomeric Golgi complex subunit 8-like n=1 Tax=Dorcoceras hygrometricum TaxID=472368 RepID=A0A2Z7DBH6_9LAMI|nr:conserved oligomeric Golgi complex subunit 8-like [Dorcoceras hygrometricum]
MALSLTQNALQINFDSVLSLSDGGMVSMFKALESSRLRGFLGCSAAVYEKDLADGVPGLTLGESKNIPHLKILTVNYDGTYIAKNKSVSTASEEVKEKSVVEKGVTMAAKRRPAPAAEPVAKKKRTTVGRAASTVKDLSIVPVVQAAIPISMVLKPNEKTLSDEDSMSIDDILNHIPEYVLPPSLSAEEPTKILFIHGVEFMEVDWYKATLTKIDPAAKGKAPLVEEIKDLAAKEEQLLKWAETNSLQTTIYRRYAVRSSPHCFVKFVEQLRLHKLKWTRPSSSILFGGADESITTLRAQLSEIIAYINRGHEKKGEDISIGPQPEYRSRPRG